MNNIDIKILLKFLDFLKEGILIVDKNKNIIYANRYIKNLLQMEDIEGKHFSQVVKDNYLYSIISHDYKKDTKEEISIKDNIYLVHIYHIEEAKIIHLQDITMIEVYKQAKKDFVSNVSHELKTPLAVLKAVIETLENEDNPKNASIFLEKAKNRIDQMDSLINDLLILAKLESKEENINKELVNLYNLVENIFEDLKHLTLDKKVSLINEVDKNLYINVDEQKFKILVKNLVENAIKYNKEYGKVIVKAKEKDNSFILSVKDTGIGIPKESLPLIFERFYRVDKSRSREVGGTGLGLSIVKHIAEAHKGKVWVESKIGEGSTFYVEIPK